MGIYRFEKIPSGILLKIKVLETVYLKHNRRAVSLVDVKGLHPSKFWELWESY